MIRFALIGLGKMGLSHLAIIRSHPDAELVAVCDSAKYVVDALARSAGLKGYYDYRTMLATEALDAVVIATPSRSHGEIARAALERNLHVFCEKPFCLDPEEGRAIARLAAQKMLANQVGYHYRFLGAFQEAKRLLDAGAIGRIHNLRAEAYGPVVLRSRNATWRARKTEGGGCLYDYACHAIDLVNFLVGEPERVGGTVLNPVFSASVEDEVYSTLYYPDGMTAQVAANWSDESHRKMSLKLNLWGTNGRMIVDRQEVQLYVRDPGPAQRNIKAGWTVSYTTALTANPYYYLRGEEYSAQIDHFVQTILGRPQEGISTFASAVATDQVAAMMVRDAASLAASNSGGVTPARVQTTTVQTTAVQAITRRRGLLHRALAFRS